MIFKKLILTPEEFNGGDVPLDFKLSGDYGVWQKGAEQYFTFHAGCYWVNKRNGAMLSDELFMKKGKEVIGWFGFPGKRNSENGELSSSGKRSFWFSKSGNCFMGEAFKPSGAAIVRVPENDGCGVVFYTPADSN